MPGVDGERDQLVERYYKKGVNGWPDPVEVTGFDGKKSLDYSAQNNFTYQKITEYSNRFNASIKDIRAGIMAKLGIGGNTQPAAPAQAPTTRSTKPQHQTQPQPQAQMPNFPPMEEEDLPF